MKLRPLAVGMTALVLLVTLAVAVHADGPQTATLEGRVIDAAGSPLPGVSITLSGPQGVASATTDAEGAFRFGLLVAGEYTVGVSLEGLGSNEVSVQLGAGQRKRVDIPLRPSSTETITVTSEAPLVNKLETSASAALEGEVSKNLSFVGRNVQSSLEVLPGVVHTATSRLQGGIQASVNGGQWQENAGMVDGVDTSFARRGGASRIFIPTTALTETRIDTAGFAAEYGRVVGGVTQSVIKSGTNQFHGDFLYIPQNQKWRAEYDELDIPREDDIKDSYELSLGGPLVRDRAWFFGSYGKIDTNEADAFLGDVIDVGFKVDAKILKLNFQPSQKHQLQLSGVDAPMDRVQVQAAGGDRFAPCDCVLEEGLATFTWSYAVTNAAFLETKVATQEDRANRASLDTRQIDPGASPDSPLGNNFSYADRASGLRYNTISQNAGEGYLDTGREQANASLTLFRGRNELKFGVDYQDVSAETLNFRGQQFFGRGYDPNLPGGFATPEFKRVFDDAGAIETTSEVVSAYAQDRIDITDRFNLYLGLRLDDQAFTNDAGEEVNQSTDLAPRLAASYDLNGRGDMLLKATAGRYYQVTGQDIFNREYATRPNGLNQFTQFRWNPATQRYDRFQQRTVPLLGLDPGDFEPYYKDEVSVGYEWQFVPNWAFEARASWWEIDDTFWSTEQFDAQGQVVPDVRNWDDGFRDYRGVVFELNRSFRSNWTLRTNYTLARTEGNNFGNGDGTMDEDDLFEALGGIEVGTGATDATLVNREGRGNADRTHNLNIAGLKVFPIGEHSIGVGGYLGFRSGERWGRQVNTTVAHPVSGQTINTSRYLEPRDANQMEDTFTLNLSANWQFPIRAQFQGRVGVEAVNVTNEQEVIDINLANGRPSPGRVAYQIPRELRFQIGVTF